MKRNNFIKCTILVLILFICSSNIFGEPLSDAIDADSNKSSNSNSTGISDRIDIDSDKTSNTDDTALSDTIEVDDSSNNTSNISNAKWDYISDTGKSEIINFVNSLNGSVDSVKDNPGKYLEELFNEYINNLDGPAAPIRKETVRMQKISLEKYLEEAEEAEKEAKKEENINDYYENQANLDFWGQATNWFNKIETSGDNPEIKELVDTFQDMINVLGTTVIVLVTIFLGIKYIFGSVESKAGVKEGLVTLIVVCVFFFGWSALRNLLFPNNSLIFIESTDTSYTSILGRIFSIATFIANILAVLGIVYVGIRYIFAGASGKGELKAKSPMLLIGIILAFASVNFLSYISKVIREIIV